LLKTRQATMLTFAPVSFYHLGTLSDLIKESYAALVKESPEYWEPEKKNWEDFDRQAFAHPDSAGKCVFVSVLDDRPVGLASYDPRHEPRYCVVGQNCILPKFQGRGFGMQQISEILRRFRERQTRTARVTTSGHPFFLPAVRMYQRLGFRETRRFAGGPDPRYPLIELRLEL
jgi:GNAT superfamily N-acetyltransferase